MAEHGAVGGGQPVELAVEAGRLPGIGQRLGPWSVRDVHEGVVEQGVGDPGAVEMARQDVMPITVELEPEGGRRMRGRGWE